MPDLNGFLTLQFMKQLVTTPEGRAHVLGQCAEAEDSGESRLFDRLLERVEDQELQRLVQRHQQDEVRHARLFRECAARTGVPLAPVPEHLKIIERIDAALDGVFERPIVKDRDVMEAYLLLQVLEERATTQFPLFEQAFRKVDPQTADTFAAINKDEERHLKYCHAISRRYAPDEATRQDTLRRFREAEAEAFADNSRANMDDVLTSNRAQMGPLQKLVWRGVGLMSRSVSVQPRTHYWTDPAPAAA